MPIDQAQIGKRLRAYRVGSGVTPEDMALRLGVSRAALYNYEREGIARIDLLERAAIVLGVSIGSLLGVDTEYFASAASFFERVRQLEEEADQVIATFEPISFLLTSPDYAGRLGVMLREGLAGDAAGLAAAERVLAFSADRLVQRARRHQSVTSIVALPQLRRLLRAGLVGRDDLPPQTVSERRAWAREEVARIAELLARPPIGVQVGVAETTPHGQAFQLFHLRDRSLVALSPFRFADHPNVTLGVASITGEPETVRLFEQLADTLWARAMTGTDAARRIHALIADTETVDTAETRPRSWMGPQVWMRPWILGPPPSPLPTTACRCCKAPRSAAATTAWSWTRRTWRSGQGRASSFNCCAETAAACRSCAAQ